MRGARLRLAILALVALASGCGIRSISDPTRPYPNGNSTYQGELSDFDVIGVASSGDAAATTR